jgi:hypothetical protein
MVQVFAQSDRTRVLNFEPGCVTVKDVLTKLEDLDGVPASVLRLTHGGKPLGWSDQTCLVPEAPEVVRVVLKGALCGGKGGFGAMLRAQGKSGGKSTTDFGACRDLNGRRLRHVNDEVKLQRWYEKNKKKERNKGKKGKKEEEDSDEERTPSGIKNWWIDTPAWAEGINNNPNKMSKKERGKKAAKRTWQQEEADAIAAGVDIETIKGKVTTVDNFGGGFAILNGNVYVPFNVNEGTDVWKETLRIGDTLEVRAAAKDQGRNKWRAVRGKKLDGYVKPDANNTKWDTYNFKTDDMADKVAMGMKKEREAKRRKVHTQAEELSQVRSSRLASSIHETTMTL